MIDSVNRWEVKTLEFIYNFDRSVDVVYTLESGQKTRPWRVAQELRPGDTVQINYMEKGGDFSIRRALG